MHTRYDGILLTWKIDLNEAHYAEVFVWDTLEHFRAATKQKTSDGRCTAFWASRRDGREKVNLAGKKFGEVHLVRDLIGAGYVAHELQHLVHFWASFCHWTFARDDEEIAVFAEKITCDFWNRFYEAFEVTRA